jgi:nucleosome binding factor SPN SPT16 subunit
MAHMMLESKRASRGKRMTSLVGKAAEDDEAFWGNEVWNEEGSDADSYVEEEEEKPDEFDSDFDETESEEESGSEEEKQATKTRKIQVHSFIATCHY